MSDANDVGVLSTVNESRFKLFTWLFEKEKEQVYKKVTTLAEHLVTSEQDGTSTTEAGEGAFEC